MGAYPKPEEISIAYNCVLLLKELTELKRSVLEIME
ncbi:MULTISPECIES: ATP-binding protein [Galbibacter]